MFIWTTMIIKDDSNDMIITKRQPVSVGEIIKEEYLEPLKITQEQLVMQNVA
jgi:hypothetical protein